MAWSMLILTPKRRVFPWLSAVRNRFFGFEQNKTHENIENETLIHLTWGRSIAALPVTSLLVSLTT